MNSVQHGRSVIKLRNEAVIFKNTQGSINLNALSSFKKHSEDDLKVIVQNYQKGDSHAAEQLRQLFYPLIFKLSHRQSMYSTFGEDAENIAWLLFFEFIYDYKGEDFARLPGLIRRFLIFRLMRQMHQQGMRWDTEEFINDEVFPERVVEFEPIDKALTKFAFEQEFKSLSEKEVRVLEEVYFKSNTCTQAAKNLNCTLRVVRYYRDSALEKLKKNFII